MHAFLRSREVLGDAIGRVVAPVTAAVSTLRHARTFHPDGIVCAGRVLPLARRSFGDLGERLAGDVIARFSAALWKGRQRRFDVLGVALRFEGDQDLLMATIRSPFTMPLSPVATRTHDFGANRYWAVSPFEVDGVGRLKFRLSPIDVDGGDGSREERLIGAVEHGRCAWMLEARRVWQVGYAPVARVVMQRIADEIDQEELRFDPFRTGLGIVPSGLVHAIRPGAYAGSQRGRD
jgi:hypothetical protein